MAALRPIKALLLLPRWLGARGIWIVTPLAEAASLLAVIAIFLRYRKKELL